jgi:hypothetical protein
MSPATAKAWWGAEALRRQLVPIDDVQPHPGNPRRGALDEIANSLSEFGQLRPILLDAADGKTIVAGNHTWRAAKDLGWSHVAAIPNDFASPEEASAYLLADNRLSDLGEYERAELVELLTEVEASSAWKGTGYTQDDLDHYRSLDEAAAPPPPPPPVDDEGGTAPALKEIVLLYDEEQLAVVAGDIRTLRAAWALEDVTDTVVEAVKREALRLNQGDA